MRLLPAIALGFRLTYGWLPYLMPNGILSRASPPHLPHAYDIFCVDCIDCVTLPPHTHEKGPANPRGLSYLLNGEENQ